MGKFMLEIKQSEKGYMSMAFKVSFDRQIHVTN